MKDCKRKNWDLFVIIAEDIVIFLLLVQSIIGGEIFRRIIYGCAGFITFVSLVWHIVISSKFFLGRK